VCWRCIPIRSRPRVIGFAPRAASQTGSIALCCASSLALTPHRFWVLEPDSDQTKALRALTRSREDLVAARVALANQFRAELDRFWPGPIGLFAALDNPISLAFLARYPSLDDTRGLGEKRMAAFLGLPLLAQDAGATPQAPAFRPGRPGEIETRTRRAIVSRLVDTQRLSPIPARRVTPSARRRSGRRVERSCSHGS
jgi:Transposase